MTIQNILILDDEGRNRDLLKRVFQGIYQVLEADNEQAALDVLNQHSVDLILLDIMLPGISGLDVLQIRTTTTLVSSRLFRFPRSRKTPMLFNALPSGRVDHQTL
jgi:CheY-like chemotaxis protein